MDYLTSENVLLAVGSALFFGGMVSLSLNLHTRSKLERLRDQIEDGNDATRAIEHRIGLLVSRIHAAVGTDIGRQAEYPVDDGWQSDIERANTFDLPGYDYATLGLAMELVGNRSLPSNKRNVQLGLMVCWLLQKLSAEDLEEIRYAGE